MLNEQQLAILTANMKGTQYSNPRIEDGKLLADHVGEMIYSTGNNKAIAYSGFKVCEIRPQAPLYTQVADYGADQNAWLEFQMDCAPLPNKIDY